MPALSLPVACCDGEDWCTVTCTSQLLARKWNTIIIHRLAGNAPAGFAQLAHAIQGISDRVLADTLRELEANGLVARRVIRRAPLRVAYTLTEAGTELAPIVAAMDAWGRRHLKPRSSLHDTHRP